MFYLEFTYAREYHVSSIAAIFTLKTLFSSFQIHLRDATPQITDSCNGGRVIRNGRRHGHSGARTPAAALQGRLQGLWNIPHHKRTLECPRT